MHLLQIKFHLLYVLRHKKIHKFKKSLLICSEKHSNPANSNTTLYLNTFLQCVCVCVLWVTSCADKGPLLQSVCGSQSKRERERESLAEQPRQRREARRRSREHQGDCIWTPITATTLKTGTHRWEKLKKNNNRRGIAFLHGHKMKGLPGCLLDSESFIITPLRLWHTSCAGRVSRSCLLEGFQARIKLPGTSQGVS